MTQLRRLLLVEDSPDDIELTMIAFEQVGIPERSVTVARDGVEALQLLLPSEEGAEPLYPELILLDLNMPRMGGLEVLQRLRQNPRGRVIPVVILTTSDEERDRFQSYELGCNSYIRKPIDYDQFLGALHQLGRYWLMLNCPPPFLLR